MATNLTQEQLGQIDDDQLAKLRDALMASMLAGSDGNVKSIAKHSLYAEIMSVIEEQQRRRKAS